MSNQTNQSTKLLVILVASLVGFSIVTGNPLLVLSAFFVLALASAVITFGLRVLRFIAVSVQAMFFMATGPKQSTEQAVKTKNQRVAKVIPSNVVRKDTGKHIAEVPAYVRKAQSYCYPITKEVLNKRTFTVVPASAHAH
jgi:flagellar biosynthesis component FlhA